ncbi:MAG: hypothetical protein ACKOFW_18460, partial [Planctomycetaceae bacterium]
MPSTVPHLPRSLRGTDRGIGTPGRFPRLVPADFGEPRLRVTESRLVESMISRGCGFADSLVDR